MYAQGGGPAWQHWSECLLDEIATSLALANSLAKSNDLQCWLLLVVSSAEDFTTEKSYLKTSVALFSLSLSLVLVSLSVHICNTAANIPPTCFIKRHLLMH
jgi:hypothetical protein